MPYIAKALRPVIDRIVGDSIHYIKPDGTLNYFIHALFRRRIKNVTMSYAEARQWIGELESAKLELYRRYIAPYEDEKIKENGDL